MHEGLNIKIVTHWICVMVFIIFLSFIDIDKKALIISLLFALTTLIYNQATFIRIHNREITLIKRILFIVPVYRKSFKFSKIEEITFISDNNSNSDFEGAIIAKLVTGSYFYDSKWKICIKNDGNEVLESDTSLTDKNVKKIKLFLSAYF